MGRKLYVGNLPYSAGEQDLQDLFAACGQVESVSVMRDMARAVLAASRLSRWPLTPTRRRRLLSCTTSRLRPQSDGQRGAPAHRALGGFGGDRAAAAAAVVGASPLVVFATSRS